MPLNWADVKEKYKNGATIKTIAGGKTFKVTKVTDDEIYFTTPANPSAVIRRKDLERFAELIEQNKVEMNINTLIDDYRMLVADDRASSAVSIIRDLGFVK